jgi:hypothetical protein
MPNTLGTTKESSDDHMFTLEMEGHECPWADGQERQWQLSLFLRSVRFDVKGRKKGGFLWGELQWRK